MFVEGSVASDGESCGENNRKKGNSTIDVSSAGPGGGSGGTILVFLRSLNVSEPGILSSAGGLGSQNGGGGGGGRIHFHWSDIPTGDVYQPIARVEGNIHTRFVEILVFYWTLFQQVSWISFFSHLFCTMTSFQTD